MKFTRDTASNFIFIATGIVMLHFFFHSVKFFGMSTSIFYLAENYSLGAFFSSFVSGITGVLMIQCAWKIKEITGKIFWLLSGILFLYLTADELFSLHESMNDFFIFLGRFSWILFLSVFIIINLSIFIPMLIREKKKAVRSALYAGVILFMASFVFGVISRLTYGNEIFVVFLGIEKGLEMIGEASFFLAAVEKQQHIKIVHTSI